MLRAGRGDRRAASGAIGEGRHRCLAAGRLSGGDGDLAAACRSGDADAQFNLGQAYRLGRGVPLDLSAAKIWFERAARSGHLDAQTTLGLLIFQNGDRAGGLKWLKQAADQGEPRALLVYGTALFNGDGVPQDPVLGYAFVSRAAAQGLEPAQETLAQLDQLMTVADRQRGRAGAARPKRLAGAKSKPKPVKLATAKPPAPRSPQAAATPAPLRRHRPPRAGGWRIQLGAFSQRGSAEALTSVCRASPRSPGAALLRRRGAVTRLQVGPFESKAAASAACNSLAGLLPVPGEII